MTTLPQTDETEQPKIDPVFKEVLTMMGQDLNFTAHTEVEVNRLPRRIDAIIPLAKPDDRTRLQRETPFIHLRAHNQVEFKGLNDRLYLSGYHDIRGRLHFYLSKHKLNLADMTLSIVCAGKPESLLDNKEITFTPLQTGYYLGNELLPTLLIVVNELPPVPQNYPLILFASSEAKFREVLRILLADKLYRLIKFAYYVRPKLTMEEFMESYTPHITEEDAASFFEKYGDRFMLLVRNPEFLKRAPAYQDIAAEWEQKILEKEQAERRRLREAEVARQKVQKQAILRTLKFRFGTVPTALVEQIETTTDGNLLDQWLDLAFEVADLAAFEATIH